MKTYEFPFKGGPCALAREAKLKLEKAKTHASFFNYWYLKYRASAVRSFLDDDGNTMLINLDLEYEESGMYQFFKS